MSSPTNQLVLNIRLRDDARFASFCGDAGEQLGGVVDAVLTAPRLSPGVGAIATLVFVSGDTETGKSHLLQAAVRRVREQSGQAVCLGDLGAHSPDVLESLGHSDLVCIDDVEPLLRDIAWCTAIMYLYSRLQEHDGVLIVSAAVAAGQLPCVLPDLQSRLRGAVVVATRQLMDSEKAEVLRLRAELRGLTLPPEVASYILTRSFRGMVHLIRTLDQLDEQSLKEQKRLTIPFVKQSLGI
jgi:DnaA family protein